MSKAKKVKLKVICDNCGDETTILVDPDKIEIDPPYFCDRCETLLLGEDEYDFEDEQYNEDDDMLEDPTLDPEHNPLE